MIGLLLFTTNGLVITVFFLRPPHDFAGICLEAVKPLIPSVHVNISIMADRGGHIALGLICPSFGNL